MHSDGAKILYLGRISEKLFLGRPDAYEEKEEEGREDCTFIAPGRLFGKLPSCDEGRGAESRGVGG